MTTGGTEGEEEEEVEGVVAFFFPFNTKDYLCLRYSTICPMTMIDTEYLTAKEHCTSLQFKQRERLSYFMVLSRQEQQVQER